MDYQIPHRKAKTNGIEMHHAGAGSGPLVMVLCGNLALGAARADRRGESLNNSILEEREDLTSEIKD